MKILLLYIFLFLFFKERFENLYVYISMKNKVELKV